MDSKLELLNIVTDLKRAVRFMVRTPNQKCFWIENLINNYPSLIKIDPNISKIIDLNSLSNNSLPPLEKAEYLLMMANKLQHYLLQ